MMKRFPKKLHHQLVLSCVLVLMVIMATTALVPDFEDVCGEYMHSMLQFSDLSKPMSSMCGTLEFYFIMIAQTMLCVAVAYDILERLRLVKLNRSQRRLLSNNPSATLICRSS